jgi:hypothetical protein
MMTRTRISTINNTGLPQRCIVVRQQLPITSAYALTDYRSQGQTIFPVFVDPATPPTGGISLFNIYVVLSRSTGRSSIRLLRDFDDQLFRTPLDTDLVLEDERLETLNRETLGQFE